LVSKTTKFVEKKSVVLSPSSSLYITKFAKNKNKNKNSQFTLDKHKFPEIPHFLGFKNNKICRKKKIQRSYHLLLCTRMEPPLQQKYLGS
jgi:hypothetical protein